MAYIEGFVAAVPTANKEAYVRHAAGADGLLAGLNLSDLSK